MRIDLGSYRVQSVRSGRDSLRRATLLGRNMSSYLVHIVHKNKIRLNQWFVPVERSGSVSLLASIQSNLTPITAGSKEWNEECFGASQRSAVNS